MKPYGHSTCSSFGGTRLDLVEIADIAELHLLGNQDCYKSLKKSLRSFANRSSFFTGTLMFELTKRKGVV